MSDATGLAPELSSAKYTALFAREAREQLRAARETVDRVAADGGVVDVDALFRSVHTIKGMAAAMGYASVEAVAHTLEDVFGRLRSAPAARRAIAIPHLPAALDALDDAVDACIAPDGHAFDPAPAIGRVADLARAAADASDDERPVPTPARHDRDAGAGDASPDVRRATVPAPSRTVRVDVAMLDRLLDLAGELTHVRDRVAHAAAHTGDAPLARSVAELGRVSGALADVVRSSRLVSLAELLTELPRIVRQAASAAQKQVLLETSGGDVVADRAVIDALAEPLTHLLRNAVDHGIEAPEVRATAGKPRQGRVTVRVARDGNALVVRVEDDGRGVDRAAVVARARARGDLHAGADGAADAVDDSALLDCLALPGLTTAREVGRLSGRGVGVDAALARVRALGGSLALRTRAGEGTCFTLRMPLSWAVVPSLVVRAGRDAYAIPLAHVRGTRAGDDGDLGPPDGDAALQTVLPLATLLRPSAPHARAEPDAGSAQRGAFEIVILAPAPDAPILAVQVDAVVGARDCVLKPVATPRGAFRVAAGATILEGGEVALVLDIPAVAARAVTLPPDDPPRPTCFSPLPSRLPAATAPTIRAR
ncbi:MAG TPA: Hpt domain-containing protein [Gemmatirosa sp.]